MGTPTFQYTTGNGCLTLAQRQFYEDNGYLIVRNFLKHDSIKLWTDRFLEYCDKKR
jgi:phytanoyl-CoA hydroxylase